MHRLAIGFLILIWTSVVFAEEKSRQPNIVLIVSDDQGYHDLGSYGNQEIKTPNLDRLAKEGVRLTDFYVTWPACTPSRGSLLTGRYPQRNGLYDMIRNDVADFGKVIPPAEYAVSPERILGMDTREVLISDMLKKNGYVCGAFGKWDGGQLKRYLPLQRGFDEYYGLVNTGIDYYTHERYGVASMYRNNDLTTQDKGQYATDLFKREALRFLNIHKSEPFFLYLPFNAPHGASNLDPKIRGAAQAPEEYKSLYPHLKEGYRKGTKYGKPAMIPTREMAKREYLGAVTCMDNAIGAILKFLDENQLADDTLVIFFSDNGGSGDADNTPLRGKKGQMFRGRIRVPCLVRFPGRIPKGSVSSEFLTSLELFPTLCQLAGTPLPQGITHDGFDMLPVLAGKSSSNRTEMFWERRADQAARVGHWKWIKTPNDEFLFDLSHDIGEKQNLSRTQPKKLAEMRAHFAKWKKTMNATKPRGPFRDY